VASKKVALVTGGATGIGKSAVLALARAGYDVAINYSSSETAARETSLYRPLLSALRLPELQAVASGLGISGTARMRKSDLRACLDRLSPGTIMFRRQALTWAKLPTSAMLRMFL